MSKNVVSRSVGLLTTLLAIVSVLALLALLVGVNLDALWRNTGRGSLRGWIDYGQVLLIIFMFTAFASTQRSREHITVLTVAALLPRQVQRVVRLLGLGVAVVIVAVAAYASGGVAIDSFVAGEFRLGVARVPIWPARIAIAVGLGVLTLQFLVTSYEDLLRGDALAEDLYDATSLTEGL